MLSEKARLLATRASATALNRLAANCNQCKPRLATASTSIQSRCFSSPSQGPGDGEPLNHQLSFPEDSPRATAAASTSNLARSGPVRIRDTARGAVRSLSSSSSLPGDDDKKSKSGKIRITDTPRSAAAAKARSTVNGRLNVSSKVNGLNGSKVNGLNGPNGVNGHAKKEEESHSVGRGQVDEPDEAKLRRYGLEPQSQHQHPAHHYIKGGTPCDPACPPFNLAQFGEDSVYTLVLLRHGESEWNSQNRYTGWCDVNLTQRGEREARTAGRLLHENNIQLDHAFTSVLKRASFSCNMALNMAQQHWVPVTKTWRLNERHYGALQGYNKDTAYQELGLDQELVMQMRRSYDVRPPRMPDDHAFWHGHDRRYSKLSEEQLENSRAESLKDCADRIMPFFNSVIVPSMKLSGNKCLIVSHANTIRTLIKHIDNISDENIKGMTIPTGIPLLYRLDKDMKPVDPNMELEFRYMVEPKGYTWGTSRAHGFHGVYLGDLERLQEIQKKRDMTNRDWQRIILRNIGGSLGWHMGGQYDEDASKIKASSPCRSKGSTFSAETVAGPRVVETRQVWWQVYNKMASVDGYSNMLLLAKMVDELEMLMNRKRKYLTQNNYEDMVNQLHWDTEGKLVEPFVALGDDNRRMRQQLYYESLALDLEEECLIK